MTTSWPSTTPGVLVDEDIVRLAEARRLITDDFDPRCVRQACYELRASNIFYETNAPTEQQRVITDGTPYILRPQTYVTAIVKERIELPPNVVARVLTKGQLFSIGILPVNTYADPGFVGRLGITLFNASRRPVALSAGEAIAKIEFEVLTKAVEKPYFGQHGYETQIWPVPTQFYATAGQLTQASYNPSALHEIARSYGPVVESIERRLRYYEAKVWLHIAVTVVGFIALFRYAAPTNWQLAVGLGVGSNLITALLMRAWSRVWPDRG